jgi:hypothetical protein
MKFLTKSDSEFVNGFFLYSLITVLSINLWRIIKAVWFDQDVSDAVEYLAGVLSIWALSLIIYRIVRWK